VCVRGVVGVWCVCGGGLCVVCCCGVVVWRCDECVVVFVCCGWLVFIFYINFNLFICLYYFLYS
jgi:hypothetical protein